MNHKIQVKNKKFLTQENNQKIKMNHLNNSLLCFANKFDHFKHISKFGHNLEHLHLNMEAHIDPYFM